MTPEPNYILRVTRIHVVPEGEAIFAQQATAVEIVDEAGGEFIKMTQVHDDPAHNGSILINNESEWNAISAAVADLFHEIAKNQPKQP